MSADCTHHWVLSSPQDEVILGRCKRCGASREYPATLEGASRQGIYDEAASLRTSVTQLPDNDRRPLSAPGGAW